MRVAGEVDYLTAPDLQLHLERAAARAKPPQVLVADLSLVAFLGSSGLAVLMDVDGQCRTRHVPLRIVATTPGVLRPLHATGLDRILSVAGSLDSVIRSA